MVAGTITHRVDQILVGRGLLAENQVRSPLQQDVQGFLETLI
jgi:hypothetical protein